MIFRGISDFRATEINQTGMDIKLITTHSELDPTDSVWREQTVMKNCSVQGANRT